MDRRTLLKAAAVVPAAAALPLLTAGPASATPRRGATIASGLDIPWGLDFLPSGIALVTERDNHRVLRVSPTGGYDVVGTVPGVVPGGEGGLLGLAVSPRYATDKRIYLYYCAESENRVAWATYDDTDGLGAINDIVTGIPRGQIHNGGGLYISPYMNIFVTCGDTGETTNGQNKDSLGGKILKIRPDGSAHPDNPFVGKAGDDRIFTYGHRNPQGIDQAASTQIWASELGQNTWDELNKISSGRNYGWPRAEGSDGPGGYTDPVVQWHTDVCSPSGLAIRHGIAWIGALRGQSLWSVDIYTTGYRTKRRYFNGTFGRVRNVKVAPDDSLWITTSNGGGADKIVQITFG